MKKYLVFLFLIFLVRTNVGAQTYTSFPENSAVWDVYSLPSVDDLPTDPRYYHRYKMHGDTIINSVNYNKVYKMKYTYTSHQLNIISLYKYSHGIRQDSLNKKVYAIFPSDNKDTLLYNFNLQVGDTLAETYISSPNHKNIQKVISIDLVKFNGKNYKRYNITPFMGMSYASLIEGVGNANGLTERATGFFEIGYELSDFCNSDHSNCAASFALNIDETIKDDIVFTISPNPFSNETYLTFNKKQNNTTVRIIDLLGKELKIFKFTGEVLRIQKEELNPGIYFVQIIDENKEAVIKKIIVQ